MLVLMLSSMRQWGQTSTDINHFADCTAWWVDMCGQPVTLCSTFVEAQAHALCASWVLPAADNLYTGCFVHGQRGMRRPAVNAETKQKMWFTEASCGQHLVNQLECCACLYGLLYSVL